ncbi:MAG: hypothetical protein ABIJ96_05590 [Elusimicrobiota bacterium]
MLRTAALIALLAVPALGGETKTRPPKAPPGGGWTAASSSLLLFDRNARLIEEIGIGEWEVEFTDGLILRRRMRGGISLNSRFAWHWRKDETVKPGRTDTILASTITAVYLGTRGQTLWESGRADAPPGVPLLEQSRDGETFLVVERRDGGWSVNAYTFTGNRITGIRGAARIENIRLTPNGRYALVLWSEKDRALTYSLLNLQKKQRQDIPAADAELGRAELTDDGAVRSGGKLLYRFP